MKTGEQILSKKSNVRDTAFWDKHYSNCELDVSELGDLKKKYSYLDSIIDNVEGKKCLDIGCGNGDLSVYLAKMGG